MYSQPAEQEVTLFRKLAKSSWVPSWLGDALLMLASLALYVHTLAPTVLPADSGEFQLVANVLGIAHPPGYPLYTMLAKLSTLFPIGEPAYRVNLFSALTSSLTLCVLSRAVRRATYSNITGWVAAAVLAVSPTFWAQATTANIRSLTALFTALQLDALVAYGESKDRRYLLGFALVFGLGVTHHGSTVFLVLPYAASVFANDPDLLRHPSRLMTPCAVFLLSFLVWLYLPLRSAMGASFDPAPIRSLSGFLNHVLALGFRGDMFYFMQSSVLPARLRVLLNILTMEFAGVSLLLAVWGVVCLGLRRRRLLILCGGVWFVNALTAIAYRAPQTVEYMMPAHVALAFLCAYGVWSLASLVKDRRIPPLLVAASLLLPVMTGVRNYPSFLQLSRDRSTREYAETLLKSVPQGACILSNWHFATPLWYLQQMEHARPDVEVVYVYPEGATPMVETWLQHIAQSTAQRPTIVTNFLQEFASTPHTFQPLAEAWLVQSQEVLTTPPSADALSAVFDQRIRFAAMDLPGKTVSPADSLTVRLYWQPLVKLERDYSFFVHLVDSTGAVVGQGDITHPAARYAVGQVLLDEYRLPLLPTTEPGRYTLVAGVYITLPEGGWQRLTTSDGQDAVKLAEVEVLPVYTSPVTLHVLHKRFACGYTLVGVDYDRSVADQLRVYLHWHCEASGPAQTLFLFSNDKTLVTTRLPQAQVGTYFSTAYDVPADATVLKLELHSISDETLSAILGPTGVVVGRSVSLPLAAAQDRYICLGGEMLLVRTDYPGHYQAGAQLPTQMTFVSMKPLTHDYTVSVSLTAMDDKWRTQHDGTPALGAIPTLKWIRGITVMDEHDLPVPVDAMGSGILRLTVYDAFTMQPLPVLDARLARLGQGTQITLGSITAP